MAKRQSKPLITETITREMAEQFFAEYADTDAKQQRIQANMDIQITKIREKYQDDLAALSEKKTSLFEKLQHFATNAPELFQKKKSLETAHGVLGFRTGTPALKAQGLTWDKVLMLAKAFAPQFVRTKEEVAKDLILAERDKEEVQLLLPKLSLTVVQQESFYVEPKKEELALAN